MSLGNDAELIFDVGRLEYDEQDFLACGPFLVKAATGYILPSRVVFDRDLKDVFGTAFNGGRSESVRPKG